MLAKKRKSLFILRQSYFLFIIMGMAVSSMRRQGRGLMVTIDGVGVPLAALVDEMTQFIDSEEGAAQLRKQSLFFMDPNKVSPD